MKNQKRQELPAHGPILWVVATPIGNLGDLSSRAGYILKSADVVLCEDTRRTRELLAAIDAKIRLERLDQHATASKIRHWVEFLLAGHRIALVSDAGTPGISDPGAALVAAARREGIAVMPIPGASAVTALISVCGWPIRSFGFRGFLPRGDAEIREELSQALVGAMVEAVVWFESPHRLQRSLELLAELFVETDMVVAKELTKIHERIFSGPARMVAGAVSRELAEEGERGEWSLVVRVPQAAPVETALADAWQKALWCLLDEGISVKHSVARICQHFVVAKKAVYSEALRHQKKSSKGG